MELSGIFVPFSEEQDEKIIVLRKTQFAKREHIFRFLGIVFFKSSSCAES